ETEKCDDGKTTACGTCNANCSGPGTGSVCGDGVLCPDTEFCDDGGTNACGPCNANCSAAGTGSTCGDGVVCPDTENCDDGHTTACGACNANCQAPGTGSYCGDGATCADTETCDDGFVDNCGTCNATCNGAGTGQSHSVCNKGCKDGTPENGFTGGMSGCGGTVTFANRATLCAAGYEPCTSGEWNLRHGEAAPDYHYWTDNLLQYDNGPNNACEVNTHPLANPCSTAPAHVCKSVKTGPSTDPLSNVCTNSGCGYGNTTDNDYMGGCNNTTAGTLCCPVITCADNTIEQAFVDGMIGCAGQVNYASRATLCGANSHVCTASEWVAKFGGQVPRYHYWTDDLLKWSGISTACSASTTVGNTCAGSSPMRVCVPGTGTSNDPLNNACNWSNCGLDTVTPNEYFGGCGTSNPTAGTLCCHN
ncbi:MAG: hypothetical protein U0263_35390, partial [Polyangiaceae bacterium]